MRNIGNENEANGMDRIKPNTGRGQKPAGGAKSGEGINASFVFHAARRWWKVAMPLAIFMAAGAAAVVWVTWKPTYTAKVWVTIQDMRPFLAYADKDESKNFAARQMQLVRSPLVLAPVLSKPEIQRQPEIHNAADQQAYLENAISMKALQGSSLYTLTYTAGNPDDAQTMANSVVESYIDYTAKDEARASNSVLKMLDEQIIVRQEEVDRLKQTVRTLSAQAGVPPAYLKQSAPSQADPTLGPKTILRRHLTDATVQEILLQADFEYAKTLVEQPIVISPAEVEAIIQSEILEQEQIEKDEETRLTQLKARTQRGENDPTYLRELANFNRLKKEFLERKAKMTTLAEADLKAAEQRNRTSNLATITSKLEGTKKTIAELKEQLGETEVEEQKMVGDVVELDFANKKLESAQEVLNVLLKRVAEVSTERNAPARVTIEQAASLPGPDKALPLRELLMAVFLAGCVPFGLAVGWEFLIKRISDTDEIESQLGLNVLGEIATMPTQVGNSQRARHRSAFRRQLFEESVDGLRTTLILAESLKDMKVLAVSSAVSSEGKTSVACQLAFSIAKTTRKPTLLIDGDMRAPDVHQVFDLAVSPGLAEVLSEVCPLEDAIAVTDMPSLFVLPAGTLASSPHQLLHNGALRKLLDQAQDRFAYIIIDTPPVLAASESLVLAKHADATLVCAMRDRTRVSQIRQAHTRLLNAGANPAGVVLSGLPVHSYARRYGSYYYATHSHD